MSLPYEITCPVCLVPLSESDNVCPGEDCRFRLPINYYRICRQAPPLPIAAVGYSTHGKTHLLATMVLTLKDLTNRDMAEELITFEVLDEQTRKVTTKWQDHEKSTLTLEPTVESSKRPVPMILSVKGIFPERTLLVYDVAGQVFHDMESDGKRLEILRNIQTVWFVISPHDLELDQDSMEADSKVPQDVLYLFSSYKAAMNRLDASLEGRNAVIVLTKGDKLTHARSGELHQYLECDPLSPLVPQDERPHFSIKPYEAVLRDTSVKVQQYIHGLSGMGGIKSMTNSLSQARMDVWYCVTSALGKDAEGLQGHRKTTSPWARQRVLDPLIWTLTLEKNRIDTQAHIILDFSAGSGYPACGEGAIPELLWKALPRHQQVRIWYLGQSAAASAAGQAPPRPPQRSPRQRLIGRLLEPLENVAHPQGRMVLITDNVVTDLEDFKTGPWAGRLLLLTTSDRVEVREQWGNTKVVTSSADLGEALDFLKQS